MPPSYNHTMNGVNLANFRQLTQSGRNNGKNGGYRAPYEWTLESIEQMGAGAAENRMSSTLREASTQLQAVTNATVANDISHVNKALQTKLSQTEQLKNMLETCLAEVISEIAELLSTRKRLEERGGKVASKIGVNASRLQVRSGRPNREMTMDDVEKSLLKQQGLLSSFAERVSRAIAQVDKEVAALESVRAKLEADLRDKAEALRVDEAVLSIPTDPSVESSISPSFRRSHTDAIPKTPHSWVRSTEDNLRNAHHWLADSARLRKAILHAIANSRANEHDMSARLNENMMAKVSATRNLREDLQSQLERVRDEQTRAKSQRASLSAALEAKRGPLAQARERLAVRRARPSRETVNDEVEAALAREVAHLASITQQLSDKIAAVDKEIASLDMAAAQLNENIRDKDEALRIDERMVMLDGRINLAQRPPSSVASFAVSEMSAPRTQTLSRIRELEASLTMARREREGMESSIRQLKESIGGTGRF
ncbi:hypothetical protein VOLCADRAFT_68705 [Volvox carteri f. nagariensis]|uniref:Tektin n=1 Tax=Volvox carteri f. nagariensis TaxID=3068 RepID=D8UGX0_VOLCA|nr:uncharacterized protein VOLCADRAFT_68705 [Volvox carteri f. nagariensis]EFJ41053.1 hypothetical protein VOLCADRAFT_68705 [Volvox carteri f. nagariensis]|eukprot:XP_002957917.1 hypothetical protein VOLCADRAFT_68705 [Volvox carteri f. nagariensis]